MINVAFVGTWHVHFKDYAGQIKGDSRCRVTALWDPDETAGRAAAEKYGCEFVSDYGELLKRSDVDAVMVCTSTDLHKDIIIKAARAKKHIFTEKVLCFNKADADEVAKEIKESGVKFQISFPWRCRSDFKWIKQAVDSGLIGKPNFCRLRNAHNGASARWLPDTFYDKQACGGGAMMDLGAHGMYLLQWLMGTPLKASSAFTNVTVDSVEDNAVTVFTYENGAIGINETAFVAQNDPSSFEIVGDKGTIMTGGFLNKACYNTGSGWVFPALPEPDPKPTEGWINAIEADTDTPFGIDDAVLLSLAMEMAYKNVM